MINTNDYLKAFKVDDISAMTKPELKRRYRILVRKYHPDNPNTGSARKFRFVKDAYDYVSKLLDEFLERESKKFFNNERYIFYGDGSVYDIQKKRWVKIKGKILSVKV